MLRKKLNIAVIAALIPGLALTAQTVPATINYQGRLTDNSPQQNPLNATVNMSFELWDCAACATPAPDRLWIEPASGTVPVAVTGGIFNVQLGGNGVAIPATLFSSGTQRWLQIYANGEALSPRQQLTATGYANQAANAATAASATAAATAGNALQLGGIPASGYQPVTSVNCGGSQYVNAITAAGGASCGTPTTVIPNPLSLTQASGAFTISGFNSGAGPGVLGQSAAQNGVIGRSSSATDSGVYGVNINGGYGVSGETASDTDAGVVGTNYAAGAAVKGVNSGTGAAGDFRITNAASGGNAMVGITSGTGSGGYFAGAGGPSLTAINGVSGSAGYFLINNPASGAAALSVNTTGTGDGVNSTSAGHNGVAGVSGSATDSGVYGANTGLGRAGLFQIGNVANSSAALSAITYGTGTAVTGGAFGSGVGGAFQVFTASNPSTALYASTLGTGNAGYFIINNDANAGAALYATSNGGGIAINGVSNGGGTAGGFQILNASSPNYALYASTLGTGEAGHFLINNAANAGAALDAATNGTGPAITATSASGAGIAVSAGGGGITVTAGGTDGIIATNTLSGGNGIHAVANVGSNAWALYGQSTSGHAVHAVTTSGLAGYFSGNVQIVGSISKSSGSFKIDHPLDPANKYLYHSFVESPDMMNLYNGNITTGADGKAVVELPGWFGALNRDFRYQLTVIGEFAQAIVAKEVENNRFVIRTSKPGVKVSWQVTGIRHDAYADAHRIPVEEEKSADERGTYLHPVEQGQPAGKALGFDKPNALETPPSARNAAAPSPR